jgi:hypothetical protein
MGKEMGELHILRVRGKMKLRRFEGPVLWLMPVIPSAWEAEIEG